MDLDPAIQGLEGAERAEGEGLPLARDAVLEDHRDRENVSLLDVRTREEYEAGHVPGSIWAPGGQAVQATDEYVAVRAGWIVLICDGFGRSIMTAGWLKRMGFPRVAASCDFTKPVRFEDVLDHRRRGIARLLTVATFQATHTKRMDLITDSAAVFYEAFEHRRMHGFRIYPGAWTPDVRAPSWTTVPPRPPGRLR